MLAFYCPTTLELKTYSYTSDDRLSDKDTYDLASLEN